jgi:hypothetical protein
MPWMRFVYSIYSGLPPPAKGTPVALTDALYLATVITAAIVVSVIAGEPVARVLRDILNLRGPAPRTSRRDYP